MTVGKNIAFGLKQDGLPKDKIRARVQEMLDLVQLGAMADRKPATLSGGQRQRVALARSLAKHPKALLLDEPLAALDRKLRDQMQVELTSLQRRLGIAFIFVTHDQDEAMSLATRMAVMREGRIEQIGSPREVYERPASRYVADFIGGANILPGKAAGRDGAFLRITTGVPGLAFRALTNEAPAEGADVWLSVRPENVTFDDQGHANRIAGIVRDAAYVGDISRYEVEIGGGLRVRAALSNRSGESSNRPARDDQVTVSWPAEAGVLLTR
jgi:putrescine transport system ATP-binding protein